MVAVMEEGESVELATIGREGMADISSVLGVDVATVQLVVQVPGDAALLPSTALPELLATNPAFRRDLTRYVVSVFAVVAQTAGCNRVHTVKQRAARWILMTHDRVDGDAFPMTQELLAMMLAVRRASVTVAMGDFQSVGLINHRHGRITVMDRAGLEATACECYRIMRTRFAESAPTNATGSAIGAGRRDFLS